MEENLLQKLRDGEVKAYQEVFNAYFPILVAFAHKYLADLDSSKEIAQNVFVKLFEKRQTINITVNLKSYLFRMVHNDCMNFVKRGKMIQSHQDEYGRGQDILEDIEDVMEQTEREYRIYQSLNKLPTQCKLVFEKSRLEGIKNQIIAEELGISVRTVETHISNALRILRSGMRFLFLFFSLGLTCF